MIALTGWGTLQHFGFSDIWVNLIMNCVTSASLSIIWNGQLLPSFNPARGLRQGDPLSSYLFVLCMERLSQLIDDTVACGVWQPIRISANGPAISHLLFVSDRTI